MNRRLYNNRSFVETAIYRVLVMIYGIQTILFYRLNQGSDPLSIICMRQWQRVLVKMWLLVVNFHPYSQDDAS
ncbi:hypothetical protein [Nostoc sp.]|uniref:hypothetical protein n=1 Tax=Nostoc sp. TaxID=1180 RepID=UPI002FF48461